MKVEIVSVGSYEKKIQFSVSAEMVKQEIDTYYRDLAKKVRLQGFRPGKAPRKVLEMRYGKQVQTDVANDLIQKGYTQALDENAIAPVSRPKVNSGVFAMGMDFDFTITVEVKPEIVLEHFKGVEVVYPQVEVSEEELASMVDARLANEKRLVPVEDRPIELGDRAIVALTALDGEVEVAKELGTMLSTVGETYYKGLEGELIGMNLNEEKTATVTFAADARNESVKGKELSVTLTVSAIQTEQVPELTDELAEELGYDGGAEGMKMALAARLTSEREELSRNQARANLLQKMIELNEFDVPPGLIDEQLEALLNELRLQEAYRGRDPRTLRYTDAQMADLRSRAQFAAKGGIILEWVANHEDLKVTDEDMDAKYLELADERNQTVEAIRGWFVKEDAVEDLRDRMLEEKTLDWLLEHATLLTQAPAVAEEAAVAEETTSEE
ncbi:MAG: trigger factor [Deltaproteobacteria bacterium]|nr:trigger factor [Deltaproteobacteria bacterium]